MEDMNPSRIETASCDDIFDKTNVAPFSENDKLLALARTAPRWSFADGGAGGGGGG